MKYKLFLYNSTAARKGAIAINIVNQNLRYSFPEWDKGNVPEEKMLPFDTSRVAKQIKADFSLVMNERTEVLEKQTPKEKIGYLCVETDFQCVEQVWPSLTKIALQEQLVLLDAQMNTYVFEPFSHKFAWRNMTLRILELNEQIKQKTEGVWQLRRLFKQYHEDGSEAAYVLTLNKSREHTLHERTKTFFQLLLSLLKDDEKIDCRDQCFTIKGTWYAISYTIEAYHKSPNMSCYMDGSTPRIKVLHRISCEKAFKWLKNNPGKKHHENYERTIERIPFTEMEYKYPNPADRFCASLNITKALLKEKIDVDYSSFEYFGSDIMFHRVPNDFCLLPDRDGGRECISALKLEEEVASFVLPFVDEKYPYFYDRYYLTDNHIPAAMLEEIKDRLVEMRAILYSGENLEVLEPYLEKRANFYALDNSKEFNPWGNSPATLKELIRDQRLNIAHVYDVFIRWAEAQLEYGDDDDLFNITGP